MSNETQLQKSFKEADLSRIRNIIEGRYGEGTKTQVGFNKKDIKYVEGDIWEDNNKKWTIKNGIKQSITKLDLIKDLIRFPLKCPNCNKAMKPDSYNKRMYSIHKKCFTCVLDMETKLKLEGKFDEYEKNLLNQNRTSHLDEFEMAIDEYSQSQNEVYMTEAGDKERWIGGDIDNGWVTVMRDYIKEEKSKTI
jgi:hypothetical protein